MMSPWPGEGLIDSLTAERDRLRELLDECRDFVKGEHQSPRCAHFKVCHCGLDDLLERIDAEIEGGEMRRATAPGCRPSSP